MASFAVRFLGAFALVQLSQAGCPELPYVPNAYQAGSGSRTSGGVKSQYVNYQCSSGDLVSPAKSTCNGNGWSSVTIDCMGSVTSSSKIKNCGDLLTPSAPFSIPSKNSQCSAAVTGPPTRCQNDVAKELYPTSKAEVVDRHNCWRKNVSPPAKNPLPLLKWDDELAVLAERWAATCPDGHDQSTDRELPNRDSNGVDWGWVGQNICYSSSKQSWSECIDNWAFEVINFEYGTGSKGGMVGHYTQVVAERSTHVGCGWAYCPGKSMGYVQVCNYGPGGNMNDGTTDGSTAPYAKA